MPSLSRVTREKPRGYFGTWYSHATLYEHFRDVLFIKQDTEAPSHSWGHAWLQHRHKRKICAFLMAVENFLIREISIMAAINSCNEFLGYGL